LTVLYALILKSRIQPERATESWRLTIRQQQRAIRRLLKSLPSLNHRADDIVREVHPDAVETAFDGIGKPIGSDPAAWSDLELDVAGPLSFDAPRAS
jgi:Domain of unknown function DUF29